MLFTSLYLSFSMLYLLTRSSQLVRRFIFRSWSYCSCTGGYSKRRERGSGRGPAPSFNRRVNERAFSDSSREGCSLFVPWFFGSQGYVPSPNYISNDNQTISWKSARNEKWRHAKLLRINLAGARPRNDVNRSWDLALFLIPSSRMQGNTLYRRS